jgi:ketosteroid isomerase-like protein
MKKILLMLFVAGILFSCQQKTVVASVEKAPIDSLMNNWNTAWSNHDSAAVRNAFVNDDVLLIDGTLIAMTGNEISEKWIHVYINGVKDMKTETLQKWSSADRAGITGKYEFDVVVKNSVVAQPKGVFTINWMKAKDGKWKITTFNAHSL